MSKKANAAAQVGAGAAFGVRDLMPISGWSRRK